MRIHLISVSCLVLCFSVWPKVISAEQTLSFFLQIPHSHRESAGKIIHLRFPLVVCHQKGNYSFNNNRTEDLILDGCTHTETTELMYVTCSAEQHSVISWRQQNRTFKGFIHTESTEFNTYFTQQNDIFTKLDYRISN